MKLIRTLTSALALAVLVSGLAGCSADTDQAGTASTGSSSQTESVDPSAAAEASRQAEAAASAAAQQARRAEAINTGAYSFTESSGYSWDLAFVVTDFLKGSDTATLDAAWRGVGGSGSFPYSDGDRVSVGRSGGVSYTFNADASAVLVGRVSVTNKTVGFSATPSPFFLRLSNLDSKSAPSIPGFSGVYGDREVVCSKYSSGMSCVKDWAWTPGNNVAPSASWSVPFLVFINPAFGPSDPEGAWLSGATLHISSAFSGGGSDVTIGRAW